MPAPVLGDRNAFYFNYTGTDDAGYNAIGAPWSYRTLPAALAALATVLNPPSATNPWIISGGPGVFSVPAGFELPAWVWITGSPDGEAGGPTVLELEGDITLAADWADGITRGGLANLVIRAAAGTPAIDLTMPVPTAGNPSRVIELQNIRSDLELINFEATGTGDAWQVDNLVQDGSLADLISVLGGIVSLNQLQSAAEITLDSGAVIGLAARITASQIPQITVTKGAAALTVGFDAVSWPLIGDVTLAGGPTLTRLSDANGEGYTPTTPADWVVVPATVQEALDELAGSGGGGGLRSGSEAIVAAQQSYPIVFTPNFAVPPTKIRGWIQMATSAGDQFTVAADMSSVTVAGATLWLGGIPGASAGTLDWEAY
jgi:hypothetical protein